MAQIIIDIKDEVFQTSIEGFCKTHRYNPNEDGEQTDFIKNILSAYYLSSANNGIIKAAQDVAERATVLLTPDDLKIARVSTEQKPA